jgi:hypothetical protein
MIDNPRGERELSPIVAESRPGSIVDDIGRDPGFSIIPI